MMRGIIKKVLDSNGIMADQDTIVDELIEKLTEAGYVDMERIKLDPEQVILCVSKIMNELQESNPIMIDGTI